jgi:hypothetical protein
MEPPVTDEPHWGPNLVRTLLLTGTYPVLTWTTYALAGLAIGRSDLRRPQAGWWLVVVGGALAVGAKLLSSAVLSAAGGVQRLGVGDKELQRGLFGITPTDDWRWLLVSAPHSGTTLDLVHTTGSAMLVLGCCLVLVRGVPRAAVLPLAAAGSMTLTLYTAHVLSLSSGSPLLMDSRLQMWLLQVAAALVIATVWRLLVGRGPLEAVASVGARGVARASVRA